MAFTIGCFALAAVVALMVRLHRLHRAAVVAILRANPDRYWRGLEIAEALGTPIPSTASILGALVEDGQVERVSSGVRIGRGCVVTFRWKGAA